MSDDYNLNLFLVLTAQAGLLYLFLKSLVKPASTNAELASQEEKKLCAKHLTVDLAFLIAHAGKKLSVLQLKVIQNYIEKDITLNRRFEKVMYYLKLIFNYLFGKADFNRCIGISKRLSELVDFSERCDILDFCMRVVSINNIATSEQLMFLKNSADMFEIENDRFRFMLEKIIPLSKHEIKDYKTILGITSDMDADQTNSQLGKEYIKWNSRVTNSNPKIRKQAQNMLELIAKAKSEFTH